MTATGDESLAPLTLVIETADGLYVRTVQGATPLVGGTARGPAAEDAARSAVARWGLPDFVFRPLICRRGSGQRELGDLLLFHSSQAVVVQVKSRATISSSSDRERSWIRKATTKAARQAAGTVRSMRMQSAELENLRGRRIEFDGSTFGWIGVVVIDHDAPPTDLIVESPDVALPVVVLLRRDWEFLFDQLRSTHAVVRYLHRVATDDPLPLGDEPARYYELAQADDEAAPDPLDPRIVGAGRQVSTPLLPMAPAGHGDTQAHLMLRVLLEDIANSPLGDNFGEAERLIVLSEIDTMPVGHRTELGQVLLAMMRDVTADLEPGAVLWRFRRYRGAPEAPHLLFGACSTFSANVQEAFRQWVMLRHHEFGQEIDRLEILTSIGILLTPRTDGSRPWDTTMIRVSGDIGLTPTELASIRDLWT